MKLLDSSFCADFLRGREHARQYRLDHQEESLVLPAIGFYELYHGAVKQNRDPNEIDQSLPWVDRLEYSPEHALAGARVRQELESSGQRIQHTDMMIAGIALSLDVPLVTTAGDFERIDGLDVENPRELY